MRKPRTGYTFATVGLGGTTPRVWYYALRAVDPNAHNYAAIVIPEDDYNEPDMYDYQSEREVDLHYLLARLELRDLLDFPWTFQSKKLQWQILRGMICKGPSTNVILSSLSLIPPRASRRRAILRAIRSAGITAMAA